jgi:hypothetical protein
LYLGVDLHITQVHGEGAVETTWPRLHPYGHFSPTLQLDPTAGKGPQDLRTRQSPSQQSTNDLLQGLQPVEVRLGHTIPPVGLGDGVATRERGERCVGIIPQEDPYFPPPDWRVEQREVKVWINSRLGSDQDVHSTQSRHFHIQVLL